MIRVYLAGALNSNASGYIQNMSRMCKRSIDLKRLGFAVHNPCLDFLDGLVDGKFEYDDYFNNSQPWLEVSDCIFLVEGWEDSKGTQKELLTAKDLGIPIFQTYEQMIDFKNEVKNFKS